MFLAMSSIITTCRNAVCAIQSIQQTVLQAHAIFIHHINHVEDYGQSVQCRGQPDQTSFLLNGFLSIQQIPLLRLAHRPDWIAAVPGCCRNPRTVRIVRCTREPHH